MLNIGKLLTYSALVLGTIVLIGQFVVEVRDTVFNKHNNTITLPYNKQQPPYVWFEIKEETLWYSHKGE